MRDVQLIVHLSELGNEELYLLIIVSTAQMHVVGNDTVTLLCGLILRIVGDNLRKVHGIGSTMDDVCAVVSKGSTGLVGHGVNDAQQCIGESHTGETLGVVHGVTGFHITVVGLNQGLLNQFNSMDSEWIGKVAVGGRNISLNSVGDGIHTGMCYQLLRHGLCQIRIYDGNIRCDLEVSDGVLNALGIISNNREGSYLCCCAGG